MRYPYRPFLLLLIVFCSSSSAIEHEIEIAESYTDSDILEYVESKLVYTIQESADEVTLQVQSFPKKFDIIKSYSLVFDLKFRENYESDIDSLCVGPVWEGFGPGEVTINLLKSNNFTNSISGIYDEKNNDGCNNYYYYLRFLTLNLEDNTQIFVGVATDYGKKYPDAPFVWLVNKNNIIEELGATKIEKYSLNFELSN